MIPDHARALRTAAVLGTAAGIPSFFLTIALAGQQAWLAFSASAFATVALAAITGRCAYAFGQLQARRRVGRVLIAAMMLGPALGSYLPSNQSRAQTLERTT